MPASHEKEETALWAESPPASLQFSVVTLESTGPCSLPWVPCAAPHLPCETWQCCLKSTSYTLQPSAVRRAKSGLSWRRELTRAAGPGLAPSAVPAAAVQSDQQLHLPSFPIFLSPEVQTYRGGPPRKSSPAPPPSY